LSLQIITKKFSSIQRNPCEQIGYRTLCVDEKNADLKNRILKNKKNPTSFFHKSFRENWFCKNCLHIFSLKPLRKYKTLLIFSLQCPKCQSENVAHNIKLNEAIIYKKPVNELTVHADTNNIEIECEIDTFLKYPLELSNSNIRQKSLSDFIVILTSSHKKRPWKYV
jgi:hypothetical protein